MEWNAETQKHATRSELLIIILDSNLSGTSVKQKNKCPESFSTAYPEASFKIITPKNIEAVLNLSCADLG